MTADLASTDIAGVEPDAFPDLFHSPSLLNSPAAEWDGITLQHFRREPCDLQSPALRDHLLVVHLDGPTLMQRRLLGDRIDRRWTGRGGIGIVPAGCPLEHTVKSRSDTLFIHLSPDFLRTVARDAFGTEQVELHPRFALPDETVYQMALLLLAEAKAGVSSSSVHIATNVGRALSAALMRQHSTLSLPHAEELPASPGRMGRVIEHMRTHLDQQFAMLELATVAGLSETHLYRAFREATGHTPHRYLVQLRIKEACRLLVETSDPIIQVGMQCGFENPTHFSTAFRSATGMSPREWRATN